MRGAERLVVGVLGASGYTGAETLRLLARHPKLAIGPVCANAQAGRLLAEVFPHLAELGDRRLEAIEAVDWNACDVVFSCLPHGSSQDVIEQLPARVTVIDLSADYRFRDAAVYEATYGVKHKAPARSRRAVYGLTEFAREALADADLVACPGCYPTATLLTLLPLVKAGLIAADRLIIDAKSGVSGAGRGLKEANLFCEAAEGLHAYSVGNHRHAPEIEQELSHAAGRPVMVSFTPHLVPMTRGEYVTIHADLVAGADAAAARAALEAAYAGEPFVHVLKPGAVPDTRHVRGTNRAAIAMVADRVPGRIILIGAIDNLVKGSGGQAIQNLNVMMGWTETLGLDLPALFP